MPSLLSCSALSTRPTCLPPGRVRAFQCGAAPRGARVVDAPSSRPHADLCNNQQPSTSSAPAQLSAEPAARQLAQLGMLIAAMGAAPGLALADAGVGGGPFEGVQSSSLYVTGALFLMSVPGIWSQVKRAPKSKVVRKTYEVEGPAVEGAQPIDERARKIFQYFKSYNYQVKETGEVIVFEGTYKAEASQAAALGLYTFFGLGSVALVLSLLVPGPGNWWYALTLATPAAPAYYLQRGTRQEQIRVKMVTSDDNATTDIILEGDSDEVERFRKEMQLREKGKVYVKGLLEQ